MIKKLTCVAIISLSISACEQQSFIVNKNTRYTQMPSHPTYEEWDHQFLWGLVPTKNHNATEMCKGDVDIVGTKLTFLNGLLQGMTYGIYTPRTYQVQCSK